MDETMGEHQPQKIIQMQFPVTWLLSVAGALILLGGGLVFQLSTATAGITDLKSSMSEMKIAQDKRDDRMAVMSGSNIKIEAQVSSLQTQVMRLNEDLNDMRRNATLRDDRNQQWQMPNNNQRNNK